MGERDETTAPPEMLTDLELRALAYFAIGIGFEGGDSGRDVSHRLSFAGSIRNGVMVPVGNSGFSIGTLQTDLGQHPVLRSPQPAVEQAPAPIKQSAWGSPRPDQIGAPSPTLA